MTIEPYNFQNIYVITTYRCNWNCEFCLFRYNKEKEVSTDEMIQRLEYSIKDSERRVYIKITGGEPFLKIGLLKAIFELSEKYHDKVYKIGIGTNGSIPLPTFFNNTSIRTHIFLSRHCIKDILPTPLELGWAINSNLIDFRINCNLISGSVDSVSKIEEYIDKKHSSTGVDHFCFRELSKIELDTNSMYPHYVHDYIDYYNKHVIFLSDIEQQLIDNKRFRYSRATGNYYDINHWYWYTHGNKKISVKFRSINEIRLIDYNRDINPNKVDEYVIHPDGTLTGCWDKDLKIIMKGEQHHA